MNKIASIVIPAQNEEAVIGRLLRDLTSSQASSGLEIVVVANGCTDRTPTVAAKFPGVRVIELPIGNKQAALNAGDSACTVFPRLYVDADVELHLHAAFATVDALAETGTLAARPALRYETTNCSTPVRRFYEARSRTSALMCALWGAGVYGVSRTGRQRWHHFPTDCPDDLFVDGLFSPAEIKIVQTDSVLVYAPRTTRSLAHTLRRVYRTQNMPRGHTSGSASSLAALTLANRSPKQWPALVTYLCLVILARLGTGSHQHVVGWERDDTTR